ncbi:MAG: PEGA domain-containing protein [Oligosphaeraceae bacterium]|nr:PEGA domain-containing protein [Oligosphaeraceae bacterium]
MKLLVIKGEQKGTVIPLADAVISIGRELDNSFVINEAGVSRHHCLLSPIGKEWFVEDCKSVNGVLVNGTKISQGTPVRPGDVFTVFSHEFKVLNDTDDEAAVLSGGDSGSPSVASGGPVVAQVSAGGSAGRWVLLGKIILLLVILGLVVYLALQVFSPSAADAEPPVRVETVAPVEPLAAVPGTGADSPAAVAAVAGNEQPAEAPERSSQDAGQGSSAQPQAEDESNLSRSSEAPGHGAVVSDVVLVLSDPAGAEVYLDGERQDGLTPLVLRNISNGRHSLELQLAGYEASRRTIHVPDIQATRPVVLRPKAGTVLLTSTPAGAHVWLERQFLGVTPFMLSTLPPGKHNLTFRGPGCEAKMVEVEVNAASGGSQAVDLQVNLGHLELRTQPPDCKVYLQDAVLGLTVGTGEELESAPLLLQNIMAGDQRFKIEHRSGVSISGRINIVRNETTSKLIKLNLPTHRLITVDEQVIDGLILETTPQGDVVIEDLHKKSERYLRPKIKELRKLSDAEILAAVEAARTAGKRGDGAGGLRNEILTIAELERAMNLPAEDFNKTHAGKTYKIYGKSSMLIAGSGKGNATVKFSPKISCQFADLSKEELEFFTAPEQQAFTFQGTCFGIGKDGILLFKNCRLLSDF